MKKILAAVMILLVNNAFAQMDCSIAQTKGSSFEQTKVAVEIGESKLTEKESGVQIKISLIDENSVEVFFKTVNGTSLKSKTQRPFSSKTILSNSVIEINCN